MSEPRAERILLIVVAGLVAAVVFAIVTTPRPPRAAAVVAQRGDTTSSSAAPPDGSTAPTPSATTGDTPTDITVASTEPPVVRDTADERIRIQQGAPGTYLLYMAGLENWRLFRWPDRRMNALRVWVQPTSNVAGFNDQYAQVGRASFEQWGAAGSPLRFSFTLDSAGSDIRVVWIDHFPLDKGREIGVTHRKDDSAGWVVDASIEVALHDSAGVALTPAEVAGVIRHEAGHALGLGHSDDEHSMMYPVESVTDLAPIDLATLRLLYTLPPGSLEGIVPHP